jgi:hypothetical protein
LHFWPSTFLNLWFWPLNFRNSTFGDSHTNREISSKFYTKTLNTVRRGASTSASVARKAAHSSGGKPSLHSECSLAFSVPFIRLFSLNTIGLPNPDQTRNWNFWCLEDSSSILISDANRYWPARTTWSQFFLSLIDFQII